MLIIEKIICKSEPDWIQTGVLGRQKGWELNLGKQQQKSPNKQIRIRKVGRLLLLLLLLTELEETHDILEEHTNKISERRCTSIIIFAREEEEANPLQLCHSITYL